MFEFQRISFRKGLVHERAPGTDVVVASIYGEAGSRGPITAFSFTASPLPGPTMPSQGPCSGADRSKSLSLTCPQAWEVGPRFSRGLLLYLPSCLFRASYSYIPQPTSQGQIQRQELLSFLFNNYWKSCGFISQLFSRLSFIWRQGFLKALYHWSVIQTGIYPAHVSNGPHVPCEVCIRLGSASEGSRPHCNRESLSTCVHGQRHLWHVGFRLPQTTSLGEGCLGKYH